MARNHKLIQSIRLVKAQIAEHESIIAECRAGNRPGSEGWALYHSKNAIKNLEKKLKALEDASR